MMEMILAEQCPAHRQGLHQAHHQKRPRPMDTIVMQQRSCSWMRMMGNIAHIAEQAYIQAKLQGPDTWITLPKEVWPKSWRDGKYRQPVVRLELALYGHPNSGSYWERYCDGEVQKVGFEPIPGFPSCYWHPRLKLLLVVYVDDFKMGGCAKNLAEGWKLIGTKLRSTLLLH